ncbi:MAG: sigma 54-interacting transcriptional regulator [Eubacteriales bacterium]
MNLEEALIELVKNEGKNPLSDQDISEKLKISREYVTILRKKLNIESSKKRIIPHLIEAIKFILEKNSDVSIRMLTSTLNNNGFNVSVSFVNSILKNNTLLLKPAEVLKIERTLSEEKTQKSNDPFEQMIGFKDSLKSQILHARAAVLYPPKGLDTIIIGETGVGKSFLAKLMYEFAVAKGVINKGKFIIFNCADYSDNIQLLYSHLFGHIKGAFTGADKDKEGLISLANEGILFLDEVHRLPAEGQEMLFSVIDNGKYRRLGETNAEKEVKVMVIAATTENIESKLLGTFRRRIPMIIELPPLKERLTEEKLQFIEFIISKESQRIKNTISISYEAYNALRNYNPIYNLGLLESELKVAIAKAYLLYSINERNTVEITLDMLPPHIREIWFNSTEKNDYPNNINLNKLIVKPDAFIHYSDDKTLDVYHYIDNKKSELENSGFTTGEINNILKFLIEDKINALLKKYDAEVDKNLKLNSLIGDDLVSIINQFIIQAQQKIPELVFNSNLKYALGYHIFTTLERLKNNLQIIHPSLAKVKEDNPESFFLSQKLVSTLENHYDIVIPDDEAGYICMYLNIAIGKNKNSNNDIGIVITCHGKVASNMLDVAKYFIKDSKVIAIDMPLEISPSKLYKLMKTKIEEMNCYNGLLLLTDMGSLCTMGYDLESELDVEIETIPRVDTVMLMDAMYWRKLCDNVKELKSKIQSNPSLKEKTDVTKKNGIIVYCITGEGSSRHIVYYLKQQIPNLEKEYTIEYVGLMYEEAITKIQDLSNKLNLKAIIGNIPNTFIYDHNIPFYTCEDLYTGDGIDHLKKSLGITDIIKLEKVIDKNILFTNLELNSKEEAIDFLCNRLTESEVVSSDFKEAIYKREKWISTYIGSQIALPHTMEFQSINHSQIAIAVLKDEIDWSGFPVKIICMFAIKENGDKYFQLVYKNLTENLALIKASSDPNEIKNIILNN